MECGRGAWEHAAPGACHAPSSVAAADDGAAAPALRPKPDRFRTGTCRDAAPAILAIGDVAARLDSEQAVSEADEKMLTDHQATLRKLKPSAGCASRPGTWSPQSASSGSG
jgi:hypothetical protein